MSASCWSISSVASVARSGLASVIKSRRLCCQTCFAFISSAYTRVAHSGNVSATALAPKSHEIRIAQASDRQCLRLMMLELQHPVNVVRDLLWHRTVNADGLDADVLNGVT